MTFHVFAIENKNRFIEEFEKAIAAFFNRWGYRPAVVHIDPRTAVPERWGGAVEENEQLTAGYWYFEV